MTGWLGIAVPPAAGQAVGASRQGSVEALSLEQLLQVEVQSVFGASKYLQKITEAPAAVTVVTAEEIERYGWRTLDDVLRSVRGFYVTNDRSWAYVGTRGFLRPGDYNTRLLLLVDGNRANDNVYDQALIQEGFQVDLRDVERIEIIRGPSSSLYGSSAFFGVINVVTKTPRQLGAPTVTADVGTLGLRAGRVSAGRDVNGRLRLGFSASATELDGVARLYFPEFDDEASSHGVASGLDYTRRRNVLGTLAYQGFTARAGFNVRQKGVPTGAYGIVFNDPRARVDDEHAYVHGGWEGTVGNGWEGRVRGAYDDYAYLGRYPYDWDGDPDTPVVNYMDVGTGSWLAGESTLTRALGSRHRITLGAEHRHNLRQNQEGYLHEPYDLQWRDRRRSSTTGLYVQDEYRPHERVLLSAGLRQDLYSAFSNPLKPRLAAIVQPDPRTSVKVVFGQAFRAPNVFEAHYVTPGYYKANPDVKPEEISTIEGVVEHYAGRRVRLTGSVFSYRVSSLIDFAMDPADGLLYYDNIETAHANGVEAEIEAKWPGGVQARLSYTYTRTWDGASGQELTNAPAHVTQALFSAPLGRDTFIGLDLRALSRRLTASGSVGGHVVPNLTLSGPVAGDRLRFSFTISNVTNTAYADPVGEDFTQTALLQNGRTARARLSWSF